MGDWGVAVVGKEVAVGEGEVRGAVVQPESGSSAGCLVHSACQNGMST